MSASYLFVRSTLLSFNSSNFFLNSSSFALADFSGSLNMFGKKPFNVFIAPSLSIPKISLKKLYFIFLGSLSGLSLYKMSSFIFSILLDSFFASSSVLRFFRNVFCCFLVNSFNLLMSSELSLNGVSGAGGGVAGASSFVAAGAIGGVACDIAGSFVGCSVAGSVDCCSVVVAVAAAGFAVFFRCSRNTTIGLTCVDCCDNDCCNRCLSLFIAFSIALRFNMLITALLGTSDIVSVSGCMFMLPTLLVISSGGFGITVAGFLKSSLKSFINVFTPLDCSSTPPMIVFFKCV